MEEHTRESLIEKGKELASNQKDPLTRDDFVKLTGISRYFIEQLFPDRGWTELSILAKIPPHPSAHGRFTKEDLLAEFHSVVGKSGKIPTLRQFNRYAKFSSNAIIRHFGGIHGILQPYKEWLITNDPNSPYIGLVDKKSEDAVEPKPPQIKSDAPFPEWDKTKGVIYGP
jgi:hypothetical protein